MAPKRYKKIIKKKKSKIIKHLLAKRIWSRYITGIIQILTLDNIFLVNYLLYYVFTTYLLQSHQLE